MYEVDITPEGLRHLIRLPDKVRNAALEAIFGPIAQNPQRLGKPLVGELEGLHSARRGDYRIIYEIFQENQAVLIHRVQHRRDVYRPRSSHLSEGAHLLSIADLSGRAGPGSSGAAERLGAAFARTPADSSRTPGTRSAVELSRRRGETPACAGISSGRAGEI